eukprot:135013-Pleurochrysis_carterae.AAC.2
MRVTRSAWTEGPRCDATPGSTRSGRRPTPPDFCPPTVVMRLPTTSIPFALALPYPPATVA